MFEHIVQLQYDTHSYQGHELQLNINTVQKQIHYWHDTSGLQLFSSSTNKLQNLFLHISPMDHLYREPYGMCVSHCVTKCNSSLCIHCLVATQRTH